MAAIDPLYSWMGDDLLAVLARNMAPPERLNVPEWATEYRMLGGAASAEAGNWDHSRAPYAVEPMLCWTDPRIRDIVLMWASQTSKTEVGINCICRDIQCDPGPALWITSTDLSVQKVSRRRFDPALDTPSMRERVASKKSRDSDRTTHSISYENGCLNFGSGNSPSALASDPIRRVVFDEIDRYRASAGDEGDAIGLGLARQTTFEEYGAKTLYISSPDATETSRILELFNQSDQRYYHVPCFRCGYMQTLIWENVIFRDGPESAHYLCRKEGCGAQWDDDQRWAALQHGKWIARKPLVRTAGFHLSQIYSTFVRLSTLADRWIKTSGRPEARQVFWNTVLGLPWSMDKVKVPEPDAIPRETWIGYDFPASVVCLVSFTDVQGDRVETTVAGVSVDETFSFVDHVIQFGDPSQDQVWADLQDQLDKVYHRQDGREMKVIASGIDCGFNFERVASWARVQRKKGRRIYPTRGFQMGFSSPIVGARKAAVNEKTGLKYYKVNADASKFQILQRLALEPGTQGRLRFPDKDCFDDNYFRQLTAEKVVLRYRKGYPVHEWRMNAGARNEALDCAAGILAVLRWLNPNLEALAARVPLPEGWTPEQSKEMHLPQEEDDDPEIFDGRLNPGLEAQERAVAEEPSAKAETAPLPKPDRKANIVQEKPRRTPRVVKVPIRW